MKIKYIVSCLLLILSITLICAQYNVPQLLSEFNKVGTFKPQAPNDFNEQRAWEIVRLMETASPTRAPRLELDLRRSLDLRSGTPNVRSDTPAESNAQITHLQHENDRLRERIQRLQAGQQSQGTRTPRVTPQTDDCHEQLQACRERLNLFTHLTSRVISSLNDFEREIVAAAHELENSAAWGFATPENRLQRMANAEQFINAARAQVQGLGNLRNSLESLFNTAP